MTIFDSIKYPISPHNPIDDILRVPHHILTAFNKSTLITKASHPDKETVEEKATRVKHNIDNLRKFIAAWEEPDDDIRFP